MENKNNRNNIIQNKKKTNHFEYIFKEIDNEQNNKSNNIYLELYNSQIKKQNLERQQNWHKQKVFLEKNKQLLKNKEELNQKKKEEEEKKRKREKYEQTKEFRQKQMENLYLKFIKDNKQTNKYGNVKSKYKDNKKISLQKIENNKIIEHNKNIGKKFPESMNKYKKKEERESENLKNKIYRLPKETIIMTENEYNLKLNLLEEEKINLITELNKMSIANKSNKIIRRESEINNILNDINNEIEKMKNKYLIYIVEK